MIPHPDSTGWTIRTALRLLTAGKPGPVHVNLPCNFATQEVSFELVPSERFVFRTRVVDRAAVQAAVLGELREQMERLSRPVPPRREAAQGKAPAADGPGAGEEDAFPTALPRRSARWAWPSSSTSRAGFP